MTGTVPRSRAVLYYLKIFLAERAVIHAPRQRTGLSLPFCDVAGVSPPRSSPSVKSNRSCPSPEVSSRAYATVIGKRSGGTS